MRRVAQTVNAHRFLLSGMSIMTSNIDGNVVHIDRDWKRAIHGYQTWHKATNIRCSGGFVTADFHTYLRDFYDFRDNRNAVREAVVGTVFGASPAELKQMHRIGVMREFYVIGKAERRLRWRIGTLFIEGGF